MDLLRLIYSSRPFGFDQGILNGILVQARQRNTAEDITGALICRADLYLQLLEGPPEAVGACYRRIVKDDRHVEVTLRHRDKAEERMFADWAMRDDPVQSWMWDQAAVASGVLETESPEAFVSVFTRLKREVTKG